MSTTSRTKPAQHDPVFPRLQLRFVVSFLLCAALGVCLSHASARAQTPAPAIPAPGIPAPAVVDARVVLPDAPVPVAPAAAPSSNPSDVTVRNSLRIFSHDQAAIWTSPARLRPHDLEWLAPITIATAAAIATDHHVMSQVVSHNTSFNNDSVNVSNALIGGLIATPVALFAVGHLKQDEHAREAGILGGEAMVDGLVAEQALKLVFWQERPSLDNARGRFFQSSAGVNSSFPSAHATIAWSAASSIAAEYHSPWVQATVYTGATAIGLTRVLGREHFPSDVLVGATTGWLIGHYVVRHHHRPLKELASNR